MKEKRKAARLKEDNEITISVISDISDKKNSSKDKISYGFSEDISVSGTKIKSNILLPVDTLLMIDFKFLKKRITALGKVKWIKVVIEDMYYQAGVEFFNTPDDAIQKIQDYISWKQNNANLRSDWMFSKRNEPKSK